MSRLLFAILALTFTAPALAEIYNLPISGGPSAVTPPVPGVMPGSYHRGQPDTGKGTNPVFDSKVPGMVMCGAAAANGMPTRGDLHIPKVIQTGVTGSRIQEQDVVNDLATDNSRSFDNCLTGVLGANEPGVPEAPFN